MSKSSTKLVSVGTARARRVLITVAGKMMWLSHARNRGILSRLYLKPRMGNRRAAQCLVRVARDQQVGGAPTRGASRRRRRENRAAAARSYRLAGQGCSAHQSGPFFHDRHFILGSIANYFTQIAMQENNFDNTRKKSNSESRICVCGLVSC